MLTHVCQGSDLEAWLAEKRAMIDSIQYALGLRWGWARALDLLEGHFNGDEVQGWCSSTDSQNDQKWSKMV